MYDHAILLLTYKIKYSYIPNFLCHTVAMYIYLMYILRKFCNTEKH